MSEEQVFDEYAAFYNLLYADKDYEAESNYVAKLLSTNGVKEGRILELGTGTGRHAEILSSNSYSVTGIEQSAEMISRCNTNETFTVIQGDIRNCYAGSDFDAAISMFHVISYMVSNDDLTSVFRSVKQQLKTGGLFLFDVWYTPAVLSQKPEVRVKRLSNGEASFTRIAEPEEDPENNTVSVGYTIFGRENGSSNTFEFSENHLMRHFSGPEIDLLARSTGFEVILQEEFLTSEKPGPDTWGVMFVLRSV